MSRYIRRWIGIWNSPSVGELKGLVWKAPFPDQAHIFCKASPWLSLSPVTGRRNRFPSIPFIDNLEDRSTNLLLSEWPLVPLRGRQQQSHKWREHKDSGICQTSQSSSSSPTWSFLAVMMSDGLTLLFCLRWSLLIEKAWEASVRIPCCSGPSSGPLSPWAAPLPPFCKEEAWQSDKIRMHHERFWPAYPISLKLWFFIKWAGGSSLTRL